MVEPLIHCDACKCQLRKDEFGVSWFNFNTCYPGLVDKPNFLECYRHICKQCIIDLADFARVKGIIN